MKFTLAIKSAIIYVKEHSSPDTTYVCQVS